MRGLCRSTTYTTDVVNMSPCLTRLVVTWRWYFLIYPPIWSDEDEVVVVFFFNVPGDIENGCLDLRSLGNLSNPLGNNGEEYRQSRNS